MSYYASAGDHYRDAIADALGAGARLASLYAGTDDGQPVVRAVLLDPDGALQVETVQARNGGVPSIVDLTRAAGWPEREAHDLHGIRFDGHAPLRPLVDHPADPSTWTVPVRGADVYQIVVGPIHASVIESGHFRFSVVGDRVLHLDIQLFYKHRGLEQAAVGVPLDDAIAYAARACGACAVTNRVAYAHAVEQLRGLRPGDHVARARTVLLELERLWSHLNDIAAICAGVGLAAGNHRFAALCEDARRLNAAITGHRLLFDAVHVGGNRITLDDAQCSAARDTLAKLRSETASAWRELVFNASFQDRLIDVGVLTTADAVDLGAVGPVARASGVAEDARTGQAGWLRYEGLSPAIGERPLGDVRARLEQREVELAQTFGLLDDILGTPLAAAACEIDGPPKTRGIARVESPRGATVCAVERAGEHVGRLHLHTGSYANWPVLQHVVPGNLLPDFPLINKSFELCYACADR